MTGGAEAIDVGVYDANAMIVGRVQRKENLFACGRTLRRQESNPHEVSALLDSKKVLGV